MLGGVTGTGEGGVAIRVNGCESCDKYACCRKAVKREIWDWSQFSNSWGCNFVIDDKVRTMKESEKWWLSLVALSCSFVHGFLTKTCGKQKGFQWSERRTEGQRLQHQNQILHFLVSNKASRLIWGPFSTPKSHIRNEKNP